MDTHSIIVVSLTRQGKSWGELLAISPSGSPSAASTQFLAHFHPQINEPDGERMGFPTVFFPMNRVERISLDEPSGSIPSMNELSRERSGASPPTISRNSLNCVILNHNESRLTVPINHVSASRLLPVFLCSSLRSYRWALLVLVVSGLSDGLTAYCAQPESALRPRAYVDPIADKVVALFLVRPSGVQRQLCLVADDPVLSRDVLILIVAVVILLTSGYRPFPPSLYGKLTTATEIVSCSSWPGRAYPNYHVQVLTSSSFMRYGAEHRVRFHYFVHHCAAPAWFYF